ncbi:MAG: hypothetical protein ACYC27_10675 [Armatimonadota bacterium]
MIKTIITVLSVVFVLAVLSPSQGAEPLKGNLTIDMNKVINPDIIGCGVNFAFSDYEYIDYPSGGEWTNIHSQHLPYPDDKKEWDNFNKLMDYMGFQYVRMCVGMFQWEPVNDDTDPHHLNLNDGFVFSPEFKAKHPEVKENASIYMSLMERLLSHWDKKDLYVVLGNWGTAPGNFCPNGDYWILNKDKNGKPIEIPDRTSLGVSNIDEYTESLAAIMYHLKKEKNYKCVKGISFFNEPEQFTNYFETLSGVYNSLGDQLTRLGIRDKVKIQAFDGAVFWNREMSGVPDSVTRMMKLSGKNIDIVSFHDYFTAFEYMKGREGIHGTIQDFTINRTLLPAMEQANAGRAANNQIPIIAGEYGAFAFSNTNGDMSKANYIQRLHSAEAAVQLLNNGGKAIAYWIYNNNYHEYWRMLTFDEKNKRHFVPDKTNYYPLALVMKYIKRGSNIVRSDVSGAKDENGYPRVFVTTAVKGKDVTLLCVNDSDRIADIKLAGIKSGRKFRVHYVTPESYDRINYAGEISLTDGATVQLRPSSITVLTTYRYGSETVK